MRSRIESEKDAGTWSKIKRVKNEEEEECDMIERVPGMEVHVHEIRGRGMRRTERRWK